MKIRDSLTYKLTIKDLHRDDQPFLTVPGLETLFSSFIIEVVWNTDVAETSRMRYGMTKWRRVHGSFERRKPCLLS